MNYRISLKRFATLAMAVFSVTAAVSQELSQEDINRAKELTTKGIGYYTGRNGYTRDFQKAYEYLIEAASLNNTDAECVLAHMYENGNGVEKDYSKAAEWYRKAADKNVALAQNSLGYFYDEGLGVEQSFSEAAKWYRKAAENNNASAQYNLANMYAAGIGVEKSFDQALYFYRKAQANGVQNAAAEIAKLERLKASGQALENADEVRDSVHFTCVTNPEFPGGTAALLNYLRTNIRYPVDCRENRIEGRVLITFVINKNGTISNIEVQRGVHSSLDREAARVISEMPAWSPGRDADGNPVRVMYSVPVNFRLN